MSVATAVRVFGSEVRVGLIQYFAQHPGTTQREAADALGLAQQLVSRHAFALVEHDVLVQDIDAAGSDRRAHYYRLNDPRVQELLESLAACARGGNEK